MQVNQQIIIEAIRKSKATKNPETLRTDIKLTEQGIDSLGIFGIILVLQEDYEIDIPDEDLDKVTTIDDMVSYINKNF